MFCISAYFELVNSIEVDKVVSYYFLIDRVITVNISVMNILFLELAVYIWEIKLNLLYKQNLVMLTILFLRTLMSNIETSLVPWVYGVLSFSYILLQSHDQPRRFLPYPSYQSVPPC